MERKMEGKAVLESWRGRWRVLEKDGGKYRGGGVNVINMQ